MSHFDITTTIRSLLLQNKELVNLVEDKVYPLQAPKETLGDFILYQRDGYLQKYTKMGVDTQKPLVYLNVVSEDYDRSQRIAGLIYDILSGTYVEPQMSIQLEDSTEDKVDGKFIQVLLFSITI